MENGNLIIRVKRRRDESVAETICIVEDEESPRRKLQASKKITAGLQNLSTSSTEASGSDVGNGVTSGRLILTRVRTIESHENIDAATIQSAADRKRKAEATEKLPCDSLPAGAPTKGAILVTNSKKTMKLDSSNESIVLVDMTQVTSKETSVSSATKKSSPTKILDPSTRKLEEAIAVAYQTGNFDKSMAAINAGANINYRAAPSNGGRTLMMCAAFHCNTRMVKQLLARGADLLQADENGWTAMEYSKRAVVSQYKLTSKIDIQQWIYRATIKQLDKHQQQQQYDSGMSLGSSTNGNDMSEDFVYDIYCAVPAQDSMTEPSEADSTPAQVVSIDGLIFSSNGQVELAFEYDSDWSDLADDEEIDSNDERFEGNDYPDEEDNDDQDNLMYGRADDDSDVDGDDDDGENHSSRREFGKGRSQFDDDYDLNDDEDEVSNRRLPGFESNRIGRVLHGGYIGSDGDAHGIVGKTKELLQNLWGEENEGHSDDEDEEEGRDSAFKSRVASMRARTGMDFASNVREFEDSGLAKYGGELEEDGDDMLVLESTLMQPHEKLEVAKKAAATIYANSDLVSSLQESSSQAISNRFGQQYSNVAFDPMLDGCESD